MPYQKLTTQTLLPHILKIDAIQKFFNNDESLKDSKLDDSQFCVEEIGDGNLNQVFLVKHKLSKRELIVKQSLPYLRCVGESSPLDEKRMHYEIRALSHYNTIVAAHTPKLYHTDEEMCLVAMEYLEGCVIMRKGM